MKKTLNIIGLFLIIFMLFACQKVKVEKTEKSEPTIEKKETLESSEKVETVENKTENILTNDETTFIVYQRRSAQIPTFEKEDIWVYLDDIKGLQVMVEIKSDEKIYFHKKIAKPKDKILFTVDGIDYFLILKKIKNFAVSNDYAEFKIEVVNKDSDLYKIKILKEKIKEAKNYDEIHEMIISIFGQADKDVGSGLTILIWNLNQGFLNFTVQGGNPKYCFQNKNLDCIYLIETKNKLKDNITGNYEMRSLPDLEHYGNRNWIGNLYLNSDKTYKFKVKGKKKSDEKIKQLKNNFFINNPNGTYEIEYKLSKESLLENIENDTILTLLKFKSNNLKQSKSFLLKNIKSDRMIYFHPIKNESKLFELEKGWNDYGEIEVEKVKKNLYIPD